MIRTLRQQEFNEGDEVLVLLVKSEVDEMLKDGIVELIQRDWASPMVIVRKKDRNLRICIDFRPSSSMTRSTLCKGLTSW